MQLLYYLYVLKNNGIIKTGRLKDLTYENEYALELNKENYQPRETLLATIEANILETISPDNVYFYDKRIQTPMVFDFIVSIGSNW